MFQPSERIALAAFERSATPDAWLRVIDGLHADAGFWWLDSAMPDSRLGRFSFAGSDPYLSLRIRESAVEIDVARAVRPGCGLGRQRIDGDPIDCVRSFLPRADSILYSTRAGDEDGPDRWRSSAGLSAGLELPFVGGAVGYFGYELAAEFEPRIQFETRDDLRMPDLFLGFVDRVYAYDHAAARIWLFGLGFAEVGSDGERGAPSPAVARSRRIADVMAERVSGWLDSAPPLAPTAQSDIRSEARPASAPLAQTEAEIRSTTDASGYAKAVDSILHEIGEGNVYQANFSQRLSLSGPSDPWPLYQALRQHNPAPFGAYLGLPDGTAVLSSSPERFLRMDEARHVESRPIKGTRPRGDDALADLRLREELASSEKDRAENLMIVDLVRNDLGRVCAPGSIAVPELMTVEAYAAVFQMVSTVTGTLATSRDGLDLVRATFPPGSMTGAPKLASIELLERLEEVRRGVYAGALGYLDVRGGLDLSVVIRTLVWQEEQVHLHVGGGVVADSSPQGEYFESLDKARAPLAAIRGAAIKGAAIKGAAIRGAEASAAGASSEEGPQVAGGRAVRDLENLPAPSSSS